MVTREPEYDEQSLKELLAVVEYERGVHACGFHRSLVFDKDNGFTFEFETCPVCAAAEQYERQVAARDKREQEAAGENAPALSSDGRKTFIRRLSDEEHAERRAARATRGSQPPPPSTP